MSDEANEAYVGWLNRIDGEMDRRELREFLFEVKRLDRVTKENPGMGFFLEYKPKRDWPHEDEQEDADRVWRMGTGMSGTDMCWENFYGRTATSAIRSAMNDLEGT